MLKLSIKNPSTQATETFDVATEFNQFFDRAKEYGLINSILDGLKNHPMEYDDQIVRQIIECVIVESKEQIRVIFAGGLEVTQSLV